LPERRGVGAALNAGVRACAGAYIGYLDDDDLLYPDHVWRTVDALQRSGADLAYTNCLAEYAITSGDGKETLGFQIFRDAEFVPKDLYVDNFAPIHSIVHRADVFERFGFFDESLAVLEDWEMWLRISRNCRFIHVDHVTCEYSWRVDPKHGNTTLSRQRNFAEAYDTIVARYAEDVAAFGDVRARQEQVKVIQAKRAEQAVALGAGIAEATIGGMAQTAVQAFPNDPFA
jgi:glycosyltransferase involved in cell wall biosynthesis